jgi:hypothetical protein
MSPSDFFDALVMLDVDTVTGEYHGLVAFGCGATERFNSGNGMLADVDLACARFPHCVIAETVSEAVMHAYNDVAEDEAA